MGDATDRHQPIQHRVSPVKSVSMVHPLEGEDTFDMGDATDRHQPIQHRVSPFTRRTLDSFKTKLKLFIMTLQAGYPLRGKSLVCVMCLK